MRPPLGGLGGKKERSATGLGGKKTSSGKVGWQKYMAVRAPLQRDWGLKNGGQ